MVPKLQMHPHPVVALVDAADEAVVGVVERVAPDDREAEHEDVHQRHLRPEEKVLNKRPLTRLHQLHTTVHSCTQ